MIDEDVALQEASQLIGRIVAQLRTPLYVVGEATHLYCRHALLNMSDVDEPLWLELTLHFRAKGYQTILFVDDSQDMWLEVERSASPVFSAVDCVLPSDRGENPDPRLLALIPWTEELAAEEKANRIHQGALEEQAKQCRLTENKIERYNGSITVPWTAFRAREQLQQAAHRAGLHKIEFHTSFNTHGRTISWRGSAKRAQIVTFKQSARRVKSWYYRFR